MIWGIHSYTGTSIKVHLYTGAPIQCIMYPVLDLGLGMGQSIELTMNNKPQMCIPNSNKQDLIIIINDNLYIKMVIWPIFNPTYSPTPSSSKRWGGLDLRVYRDIKSNTYCMMFWSFYTFYVLFQADIYPEITSNQIKPEGEG